MAKRFLLVALAGAALAGSVGVAHAASKYTINDHVRARSLTGNAKLVVYTGVVTDKVRGEGSVIIRSRPSSKKGVLDQVSVAYFRNGSITLKGTTESETSASGTVTYKGSAKAVRGTGVFKGVTGNVIISGAASSADPTLANLTVKGTFSY
jgi:hypothetical protein